MSIRRKAPPPSRENGPLIPVQIRMDEALIDAIDALAIEQGRTRSQLCRVLLSAAMVAKR